MNKSFFVIIILFFIAVSCDKPVFEKPKNLISENQMVDMLVDIHMAEATYKSSVRDSLANATSDSFYYGVLEKWGVPDSVFEKSFVYYAGNPKNFEKMYQQVMNKLNELQQELSGRENELLEFEKPQKQRQ